MYPGEYNLIGNELSFFTRKLEAQLRFQRIPSMVDVVQRCFLFS